MAFLDAAMLNGTGQPPMLPPPNGSYPAELFEDDDDEEFAPEEAQQQEHPHARLVRWIGETNIAEELQDDLINKIGQQVIREYKIDDDSRKEWLAQNEAAFKLAMQVAEKKTFPWVGASNVIFPLMTVAAIQFAARAYPAIIQGRNVVKGGVLGNDKGVPMMGPDGTPAVQMAPDGQPQPMWQTPPGAKRARADKIAAHMSWQLLNEMEEWEEDTDTLLHVLPIVGCDFRKSYYDPSEECNISCRVSAENLVINYWAKSMARAPRLSERLWYYPHEIEEMVRSELWLEHDYGRPSPADDDKQQQSDGDDSDAPHEFIEQHRRLDLDEDGYAEPYIVTVHKSSGKVARIVACYDADGVKIRNGRIVRIEAIQYYTKYDFLPNPEGGIYGIGFGKLLSPLNRSVNTIINQLIDSGTLANTPSGFIGRGLSMHSGAVRFKMGEFKVINAPGARIREAIVPLEFKEPSAVLFSLLGLLIDASKDVGMSQDVLSGETTAASMQPTTLLGLIDQGLNVFSGIYKRVHRSIKRELDKLYRLNRIYLEDGSGFPANDNWQEISREDYGDDVAVFPISDPAMVSNMQKMARAELLRSYTGDPLIDQVEIRRRTLDAAEIPDAEELIVKQPPQDPNMLAAAAQLQLAEAKEQREASKSRSEEIKNYAAAVQHLAQADKLSADENIDWAAKQLDFLKLRMEMLNGRSEPNGKATRPNMPKKDVPPMMGARQARDGNWYVPDQGRPGKFLRVIADAA